MLNIQTLQNKTILLLGNSRAFSQQELQAQCDFHHIILTQTYNKNVDFIVEGSMMTPYEQLESEKLYEQNVAEFITLELFEKLLTNAIDEDTLLMSLRLSQNTTRIESFLQNDMLSEKLFFKLLKLYEWHSESFFDTNRNRDMSATIIRRFYKNIYTNHNVEYATSGFIHLLLQTENEQLIEAIFFLEPLQNELQQQIHSQLLELIATHPHTPRNVLQFFITQAINSLKALVAQRVDCDVILQKYLYKTAQKEILQALSTNPILSKNLVQEFDINYKHLIAQYRVMDDEIFNMLLNEYSSYLAKNTTLNYEQQLILTKQQDEATYKELASNPTLDDRLIQALLLSNYEIENLLYKNTALDASYLKDAYKDEKNHLCIAQNKNTPSYILEKLSHSPNIEILKSVAKNENTPIEVLYQLQLNAKVQRSVKENPTFSKHVQTQNLGWLV